MCLDEDINAREIVGAVHWRAQRHQVEAPREKSRRFREKSRRFRENSSLVTGRKLGAYFVP